MAKEELPVDKGWAWVVCGAVFIITFLVSASGQVISVTLLDLVAKFETTLTTVSLMFMFQILATSVFSIVSANFLVPRFGIRRVCVISSFVTCLASIAFSASPSIYLCIVLFGIKGICAGCYIIPAISILGFYFKKHRSIATTISMSGICCGSIAYPPLVRAILAVFGLNGTYLLSAAVETHLLVASMLIRPISSYRSPSPENAVPEDTKSGDEEMYKIKPSDNDEELKEENANDKDAGECLLSPEPEEHGSCNSKNELSVEYKNRSVSFNSCENDENSPKTSLMTYTEKESPQNSDSTSHTDVSKRRELFIKNKSVSIASRDDNILMQRRRIFAQTQKPSLWSLASYPSTLGIPQEAEEETTPSKLTLWERVNRIFDFSLFKNWSFIWVLAAALPCGTNQLILLYLPTIGTLKGLNKDDSALLLTIMGSVDLGSRLLVGLFADTKILRVSTIIGISSICLAIVSVFIDLYEDLNTLIIMAVCLGLFVGIRMSLGTIMFIEIVGLEKMSKAFSIYAMCLTLSGAIHNPLLGRMMESSGVSLMMYYLSAAFLVGGIMILTIPFVLRTENKCKNVEDDKKLDPS